VNKSLFLLKELINNSYALKKQQIQALIGRDFAPLANKYKRDPLEVKRIIRSTAKNY
jgi:hypothetical protein